MKSLLSGLSATTTPHLKEIAAGVSVLSLCLLTLRATPLWSCPGLTVEPSAAFRLVEALALPAGRALGHGAHGAGLEGVEEVSEIMPKTMGLELHKVIYINPIRLEEFSRSPIEDRPPPRWEPMNFASHRKKDLTASVVGRGDSLKQERGIAG